jgi:hypothetical protein
MPIIIGENCAIPALDPHPFQGENLGSERTLRRRTVVTLLLKGEDGVRVNNSETNKTATRQTT